MGEGFDVCELGVSGCDLWGGAFGAAELSRWCLAMLLGRLACGDRVIVGCVASGLSCGRIVFDVGLGSAVHNVVGIPTCERCTVCGCAAIFGPVCCGVCSRFVFLRGLNLFPGP